MYDLLYLFDHKYKSMNENNIFKNHLFLFLFLFNIDAF
jgi:hypothetical protein